MHAIKHAYQTTFGRSMEADVKGDLSMKTERLFGMAMAANRADESTPVNLQELDHDWLTNNQTTWNWQNVTKSVNLPN